MQAANGGLVDLLGGDGDQQLLQGVVHIERLHIAGREPQLLHQKVGQLIDSSRRPNSFKIHQKRQPIQISKVV
jgi:hypothetical protein